MTMLIKQRCYFIYNKNDDEDDNDDDDDDDDDNKNYDNDDEDDDYNINNFNASLRNLDKSIYRIFTQGSYISIGPTRPCEIPGIIVIRILLSLSWQIL